MRELRIVAKPLMLLPTPKAVHIGQGVTTIRASSSIEWTFIDEAFEGAGAFNHVQTPGNLGRSEVHS